MQKDKPLFNEIFDNLLDICVTLTHQCNEDTYDMIAQQLLDIYSQLAPYTDAPLSAEEAGWLLHCKLMYKMAVIMLLTYKPQMLDKFDVPIKDFIANTYDSYPLALPQADGALTALLWLLHGIHTFSGDKDINYLPMGIAAFIVGRTLNIINQFRLQPFLSSHEKKDIPPA